MFIGSRVVTVCAGVTAAVVMSILPATAISPAVDAPPKAGATYKGYIVNAPESQRAVRFVVSNNGNWVRKMRLGAYPVTGSCGSGGDVPTQTTKPARIKDGKFTAHVVYWADGDAFAKATVTGTFLRGGKEKGVVTSHRFVDSCVVSLPYRTSAN